MRKLLPLLSALALLGGCKKNTPANPASATFYRSINGSSTYPWNFNRTDQLSFTQSYDMSRGAPHTYWTMTLLYGPTGLYVITQGTFANIPIAFAR
jgi:hypothetical protein